jgi:hypothetical protein
MRVADEADFAGFAVFGLFEESFEFSGGAFYEVRFNFAWH